MVEKNGNPPVLFLKSLVINVPLSLFLRLMLEAPSLSLSPIPSRNAFQQADSQLESEREDASHSRRRRTVGLALLFPFD